MSKVRIYDLAKELKLENKRVLEDARLLGVDASVASNSLDDTIAAKIREKYYPKKEQVTAPKAKIIKRAVAAQVHPELVAQTDHAVALHDALTAAATGVQAEAHVEHHVETGIAPHREESKQAGAEPQKARIHRITPPPPPPTRVEEPIPVEEVSQEPVVEVQQEEPVIETGGQAPEAVQGTKIREFKPKPFPVPVPEQPAAEAAPATQPAEHAEKADKAEKKAHPASAHAPTRDQRQAGTKVFRITPPPSPLPAPAAAAPANKTHQKTTEGTQRPRFKETLRELRGGKPAAAGPAAAAPAENKQLREYIPPKDQRPRGRHQQRKEKEHEGQQKVLHKRSLQAQPSVRQVPVELKPVRLVEGSTVREFAERIDAKPRDIVTNLMQRGVMATINQTINPEMAKEIGKEYGWDVTMGDFEEMIVESEFEITPEAMEDTNLRAPVITVMGHVDHGKTSLLDAIREARVAEGEAGGITQHIGAYSVQVSDPEKADKLRRVVFLDTPGHEAFTLMRARGAKVTDIVVLVVAADDGVMPQTVEAIEHAKAAEVPIVVAINKIDKPDANPERVKKELADRGLLWDNWGGDTTMVEVSAKKRQNISGLLEMLLLTADMLDLKANPTRKATGTVLEAKLDRGRGAVATVLIQNGTLRVGEPFIVGNYFGKVRALVDDLGQRITSAGPATPVEVLGLEGVPSAGDQFQVVDDISKAQQISQFRQSKARATSLARSAARGLDQLAIQLETGEVKELLVILKADVQGSVEVLKDTLVKLSTEKVKVRLIRSGVGAITESDVLLASASNATTAGAATVIIGFNVRPETRADEIAKQENVDIRLHSIIYKVEEEIRNSMLGLMDATLKEVIIGKAEVRDVIRVPKVGSVAGCMVLNGSIKRTAQARLIRDNVVIFESNIGSLRRFKDDTSEVQQGFECGITVDRFNDYKLGDVIEAFITEKVAPTRLD